MIRSHLLIFIGCLCAHGTVSAYADPLNSITCGSLKIQTDSYVIQYGETALGDIGQLTQYLNAQFAVSYSQTFYLDALSECNLVNTSIKFNGSTSASYVSFGKRSQYLMGTSDFTIEAWVKYPMPPAAGVHSIVANQDYFGGGGNAVTGFNLCISERKLLFVVGDGSNYSSIISQTLPSVNQWHHVVALRIGNQASDFKIFVDGIEIATTVHHQGLTDGNIDQDGVEDLKIGSRTGSFDDGYFIGDINEVRIYKRALSAAEIVSGYNEGCPASPVNLSSLVLWVPFNEGQNTSIADISSFGATGSIAGIPAWSMGTNSSTCINEERIISPAFCESLYCDGENIGIGTRDTKGYRLAVAGSIIAERVKVATQSKWADFVFEDGYDLDNLSEVERFINKNRHLPGIPTAEKVKEEGYDMNELDVQLLKKIEELTLYLIQQNKEILQLKKELAEMSESKSKMESQPINK